MNKKIKVIKLNNGQAIEAICPEHGQVKIISLPTQGSGSMKRISVLVEKICKVESSYKSSILYFCNRGI